ncbi:hypothetical protein XELAEV_18011573mg [Xenopus laevis]|uniref:Uncharacterized protein n=1 Tax=Xenopus laevis TaxID=8355 RepID=A0A974HXB2_XENLA|nr:hypothetical protein XELAEV_18011573mg [Xenopus laevis]
MLQSQHNEVTHFDIMGTIIKCKNPFVVPCGHILCKKHPGDCHLGDFPLFGIKFGLFLSKIYIPVCL